MTTNANESDELKCETYSIPEAGFILGFGRDASYAAARTGKLPTVKWGKTSRVTKPTVERLLENKS
jgi:hypothetical protein